MTEHDTVLAIRQAVMQFLRGRADMVVIGAMGCNFYFTKNDIRETVDVDIVCLPNDRERLAIELAECLRSKWPEAIITINQTVPVWHVAVDDMVVCDICAFHASRPLPEHTVRDGWQVATLTELIRQKAEAVRERGGTPKGLLDMRDLMLLQAMQERER